MSCFLEKFFINAPKKVVFLVLLNSFLSVFNILSRLVILMIWNLDGISVESLWFYDEITEQSSVIEFILEVKILLNITGMA